MWSACDPSCGNGISTRTRDCMAGNVGDIGCHEGSEEEERVRF